MMSLIDLHKFVDVIFGIIQNTALNDIIKLGQIIYDE